MRALMFGVQALVALVMVFEVAAAWSQETTVRIAQQYGLAYLPLTVAIEGNLIEKQAAKLGLPGVKVEVSIIAGGPPVNDALISGSIDVAMAGATVLATLWDRTYGRDVVKGMMAISDTPYYFNTIDPRINSLRDFTPQDRIAMSGARGSQTAVVLQMAAAQAFGWEQRSKLDDLSITMAQPDGVAALLSGGAILKTHGTTVPFIQMELADPRVRTILKSSDVVGGRHTLIVAYTRDSFFKKNPKLYEATYRGLSDAIDIINADKSVAVDLIMRVSKTNLTKEQMLAILNDDNMLAFSATPTRVMPFVDYMVKNGMLKNKPARWEDLFFPNVHHLKGS
jgi:NitT/TauT family transport system substrate-binding protein